MSGGLLQLAWRNLWRNRRRTFITMAAIAFGYAMLLFVACLMAGLRWQMIQNGTWDADKARAYKKSLVPTDAEIQKAKTFWENVNDLKDSVAGLEIGRAHV